MKGTVCVHVCACKLCYADPVVSSSVSLLNAMDFQCHLWVTFKSVSLSATYSYKVEIINAVKEVASLYCVPHVTNMHICTDIYYYHHY